MNKGINLLADKRDFKSFSRERDRLKIFRFGAVGLLFAVSISSMIVSILIVFSPLPQLAKQEQEARDKLAALRFDIMKLVFINERGDSIRKILNKRPAYDKKIEIIKSKVPAGVTLDGLTISKKLYSFKFSSTDLALLDELLNNIMAITGKGRDFFRIYLEELSIDGEGKKFVITIDLLTT